MTGNQLFTALHRMSPEELDLPIVGIVGSSGAAYELGSIRASKKAGSDDSGPLCDEPDGTPYISLYLGN
jgi:hypothetical protein